MPSLAKYRRTWFALLREAGIHDEDRHWVQETLTGKPSTRDWAPDDWRMAIASLQRDLGQHDDAHAHVCEDQPRRSLQTGDWASWRQCATIQNLCAAIEWKKGPEQGPLLFFLARPMRGPTYELRRAIIDRLFKQGIQAQELWRKLTRIEASNFIRALIKLHHFSPRQTAHIRI